MSGINAPWGVLTGVRPVKLLRSLIDASPSPQDGLQAFMEQYKVSPEKAELAYKIVLRQNRAIQGISCKDICLYIGVPFCKTRCSYCSFVTAESGTSRALIPPFVEALLLEIERTAPLVHELGLRVVSLYFGGGTPTVLEAEDLSRIIDKCRSCFPLAENPEFTVEAGRPDTIDRERLAALSAGGVTRISINPQSMNDEVLRLAGRGHSAREVLDAFCLARSMGFSNINMDLIAGLPGDTPESFSRTLEQITALAPESVTVHTLTLKNGAYLPARFTSSAAGGAADVAKMTEMAMTAMEEHALPPYYLYRLKNMTGGLENVGYARAGFSCLYNILVMEELTGVISLGGGGITKIISATTGKITRIPNAKEPKAYISRIEEMIGRKRKIMEDIQ